MKMWTKTATAAVALVAISGTAQAAAIFNPGNGHYYEFVGGQFTIGQALALSAAAAPIAGFQSHLVTITSAAETSFLAGNVTIEGFWIAGSDAAVEGVWRWISGPETGQIFFGPGAPVGAYSNWAVGEPNNFGSGEHFFATFGGANLPWFDYGPPFAEQAVNYVVEYSPNGGVGGVPEPASWALMLGGFGLTGAAMRRRQRTVSVTYA
jgi:PEP-CTERM motif